MADGDHYAAYADIGLLLMNTGLAVAGNTLLNDTGAEVALDVTMAMMHSRMGIETLTKLTNVVHAALLKGIQIDLVAMQILRARIFNENNISSFSEGVQFWQITPYLTRSHEKMLDKIVDQNDGVAWSFNVATGREN